MNEIQRMITALSAGEPLQHEDWLRLIADASEDDRRFSRDLACKRAQARFGRRVFFRGIIEFTNYLKTTVTTAASAARTDVFRATG